MLLGILEISRLAHPHWLVGDAPLIYRPTLLGVNNRFVNKSVSSVCDTILPVASAYCTPSVPHYEARVGEVFEDSDTSCSP
jgi:hypothetical protein